MNPIANSTDIASLLRDFNESQAYVTSVVKSAVDSIKAFGSVKIDKKVKEGINNVKGIQKVFRAYSEMMKDMIVSIDKMVPKDMTKEAMIDKLSLLSGDPKKTITNFNSDGVKTSEYVTNESAGILDILGNILNLFKAVSELNAPNTRRTRRVIMSYSDSINMLYSFVSSFGDAADYVAARNSAYAAKTITDALLNITGVFTEIDKNITPLAGALNSEKKTLERGLKILYDPTAEDDKQFSIISTIVGASDLAANINKNSIKDLSYAGEEICRFSFDMGMTLVALGNKRVHDWIVNGASTLTNMFSSINVPELDPETIKNANKYKELTETVVSTVSDIGSLAVSVIINATRAYIAFKMVDWLYEGINRHIALNANLIDQKTLDLTSQTFTLLSSIAVGLDAFVERMPRKRSVERAMNSLLVIGEILGDKNVKDQFMEGLSAISLMADESDKISEMNKVLAVIGDVMRTATGVGLVCITGMAGLYMVGASMNAFKFALDGIMRVTEGIDPKRLDDARKAFEDMGRMVAWCGAMITVCALVGALTILALPVIAVGFAAIAVAVMAFTGLMVLIQRVVGGREYFSHAQAIDDLGRLILMAGAVIAISVLVGLLVIKTLPLILVGFSALMLVTLAMVGILWVISKIGEMPGLKIGMVMFVAMLLSMMGAALMMNIVAKVGASIDLIGIIKFIMGVGLITAAYIGLGLAMAAGGIIAVLLATAGIVLISLSMIMAVTAISSINKAMTAVDPDTTRENIGAILSSMKYMVDYLRDNFTLKDMAAGTAKMIMLGDMSKRLMRMANRMQKIASLTMDEFDDNGHPTGKTVKMRAEDFMNAALNGIAVATTIASMFNDNETVIKTAFGSFTVTGLSEEVLEKITNKSKRKVRQLYKMTKFIGKMADVVTNIASMKMATEWGPDGKAVAFTKMSLKDFTNAAVNGVAVAETIASIFSDQRFIIDTSLGQISVSGLSDDVLKNITNSTKRKVRQLYKITKFIGRMTDTVANLASLKVATEWNNEGKPVQFAAITASQMKDAAINAVAVTKFFAAIASDTPMNIAMSSGEFVVESIGQNVFEKVDRELKRKFRFLRQIVGTISNATKTVVDLAVMRVPSEWNRDGKPIKYDSLGTAELNAAAKNVVTIMTTLTDAIVGEEMTQKLSDFDRNKKRQFETLFAAVTPITSMVEAITALAGGSVQEFDANGNPTGKQVSIIKALEAKPDIINGIVSMYSIFTDALSVITGQESVAENTAAQTGGLLSRIASKVTAAASAVISAGTSMVKNVQARIDTDTAAKAVKGVIDPVMSMVDAVKKINETMVKVDLEVGNNLKLVMTSTISAVTMLPDAEFDKLDARSASLDRYADVIKKFMTANEKKTAADNVHRTMEDTSKFVVQLNKVSDSKLAKMASITKNMSDFARRINGNFDRLADAMNDKMVTALEKVEKTLAEVNKTMDQMPAKMRAATNVVGGGNTGGETAPTTTGNSKPEPQPKPQPKPNDGKNITGKTINNCIVQADDGTYAIAVIQKYE